MTSNTGIAFANSRSIIFDADFFGIPGRVQVEGMQSENKKLRRKAFNQMKKLISAADLPIETGHIASISVGSDSTGLAVIIITEMKQPEVG